MREGLDEPVSVVWYYDSTHRTTKPHIMNWNGQDYRLGRLDFWHKTRAGRTLIHHFSIADTEGRAYFKLALNTDSLQWTIEEYMTAGEMVSHYRKEESHE
jgi:hypothetical protein